MTVKMSQRKLEKELNEWYTPFLEHGTPTSAKHTFFFFYTAEYTLTSLQT